jgi:hypothetical protein
MWILNGKLSQPTASRSVRESMGACLVRAVPENQRMASLNVNTRLKLNATILFADANELLGLHLVYFILSD